MDEAIRPINVQTTKQRIKSYSSNPGSLILAVLVGLAALITFLTLVFIIGYILVMGIPNLKPSLFQLEYNSDNVSMLPSIINTVGMTLLSLVIAGPLGITRDSRVIPTVLIIEGSIETLSELNSSW